jgi:acyl dehydratase
LGQAQVWKGGSVSEFIDRVYEAPKYESESHRHRDLELGQVAMKKRSFSREDLLDFLSLVDEINPIHTDREYAQSKGFQEVLLPGGLLGGMISDLLGTQLPGRGTNWLKQRWVFLSPAYPGEEITARVEIIRLRPEKDLVTLRTTLTNQEAVVVDGEALVLVSDLEA